jgi:ADP-ribose pyrophosphatase YjhB (NUDIX family)
MPHGFEVSQLSPAEAIAFWAEKLRDMSASGLLYAENIYHQKRYEALQSMAVEMQAYAGGECPEDLTPLRDSVFAAPTPFSAGDGAVFDGDGRLLLIRRADNQKWAMPGGAFEVGESPAEGTLREVYEETGLRVRPLMLIGVFDSRFWKTVSRHHIYHFLFLCEPIYPIRFDLPEFAEESLDRAWFSETNLPEDLDPGHEARIPFAFSAFKDSSDAYFDPPPA